MSQQDPHSDPSQEIELYRNLAENACDLICQTGPTGRYLYVSPNYEQILGYQPDELIGVSIFKLVHPDDLPEVNRRFVLGVVTQQPAQIQFRYRHKNGEWRWLEVSGKPFFGWKGLWRATFISRDITHRRETEERLQRASNFRDRVLASTTNAIVALDREGRFLLVNRRMLDLTHYAEEELQGRELISLLAPRDKMRMHSLLLEVLEKQQIKARCEVVLVDKHGHEHRLLLNLSPLQVDDRNTGVVLTGEDVTEFRQAEQEREHLLDQLETSQKMEAISMLTAGVAHDFNNILTGMLTTTQLLQLDNQDKSTRMRLLELQQKSVERAITLTGQLLGFSRQQKMKCAGIDLVGRVNGMLDFCSTQLDPRIEVRNELPPEMPQVWGDGRQIDQILLNLLVNAGQALLPKLERKEPARITLRMREEILDESMAQKYGLKTGMRMIRLSVEDTGIGIPLQLREKIFEPFFTTKTSDTNHGLGLATVATIVKNHEGTLEVESTEGIGATFHIYLPVLADSDELTPPADSQKIENAERKTFKVDTA